MKQIYVASYFRNGYSRFMKYIHDVFDHPKRESIEQRLETIKFCDEFGLKATKIAFGKSRSTIYLWKQKLKVAGGKLSALAPGDRAPLNKRHRVVHPFIESFVIGYRSAHPDFSRDKTTITPVLNAACIGHGAKPVSESTVGRIIHDLKTKGKLPYSNRITINGRTGRLLVREPKTKKKLRRKGFVPKLPGDLVQMSRLVGIHRRSQALHLYRH